jgi:hypothetical protein
VSFIGDRAWVMGLFSHEGIVCHGGFIEVGAAAGKHGGLGDVACFALAADVDSRWVVGCCAGTGEGLGVIDRKSLFLPHDSLCA